MPRYDDIQHSVLVVSASDRFDALVRKSLMEVPMTDFKKSAASARRSIQERYYDIAVINCPLPDESGEELALYIAQQCSASVLMVVPSEEFEDVLDHVTDQGILVIPKPFPRGRLDKAVRFLMAVQTRMHGLEKQVSDVRDRMEELRVVSKAKFLLVENRHMSEDEAHRWIGKQAMNGGVSRKRIAEKLLEEYE